MQLFSKFGSIEALLKFSHNETLLKIGIHRSSSQNSAPQKLFSKFGSFSKFLSKPVPQQVLVRSLSAERKSTSD